MFSGNSCYRVPSITDYNFPLTGEITLLAECVNYVVTRSTSLAATSAGTFECFIVQALKHFPLQKVIRSVWSVAFGNGGWWILQKPKRNGRVNPSNKRFWRFVTRDNIESESLNLSIVQGLNHARADGCIQRVKSFYWTILSIAEYQLTSLKDLRAPRKQNQWTTMPEDHHREKVSSLGINLRFHSMNKTTWWFRGMVWLFGNLVAWNSHAVRARNILYWMQ